MQELSVYQNKGGGTSTMTQMESSRAATRHHRSGLRRNQKYNPNYNLMHPSATSIGRFVAGLDSVRHERSTRLIVCFIV